MGAHFSIPGRPPPVLGVASHQRLSTYMTCACPRLAGTAGATFGVELCGDPSLEAQTLTSGARLHGKALVEDHSLSGREP